MATVYIGDIPEDVRQRDVEDFFRDYKERVFFFVHNSSLRKNFNGTYIRKI